MARAKMIMSILLTGVTLAGVTSCSEDGDAGGGGTLLAALGKVRATEHTRLYVEWGNVSKVRGLWDQNRTRFAGVLGTGMGNMRTVMQSIPEKLGFDPVMLDAAIMAGESREWAVIAWGDYDLNGVNGKLAGYGADRSGDGDATTWTVSADGDLQLDNELTTVGGPGTFNNVRTAPGSFAFAPKADDLSWVTRPGDDTLAEDPIVTLLAECLGDVIAAVLSRTEGGAAMIATGVRASSVSDVTDVICVAPGTRNAGELRDKADQELAGGNSPRTDRPWSELLPGAKVEVTGLPEPAVRLTSTPGPDDPAGRPVLMNHNGELDALFGLRGRRGG